MTKVVKIGDRVIGGGNPILIQSMTNTKTEDVRATVAQIQALTAAGCDIIRCAVPTQEAASALKEIKKQITIPLVADIHFDYKLAIAAIENGADKIRINPGNIGSRERVQAVVDAAKERNIPIRVGVNSGSLEKDLVKKYGGVTAQGLVESALGRAFDYEAVAQDKRCVDGTCVLKQAAFGQELAAEQALADSKMGSFLLLRVVPGMEPVGELVGAIGSAIRESDAAGLVDGNVLYLLMRQAKACDLPIIRKRLSAKHIAVEPVDGEGIVALLQRIAYTGDGEGGAA